VIFMSSRPKTCVLTGFGINSELELAYAFEHAGANTEFVHIGSILQNPKLLEDYQILALPGGWSFADDIQSGRVLANKLKYKAKSELKSFIDSGKPVIGICNGFQVLIQLGALPGWDDWNARQMTLFHNKSGRFIDRWVNLRSESSKCKYAQNCQLLQMPIRHGEGQLVLKNMAALNKLDDNGQIVFRYAADDGLKALTHPHNPNGSADAIAGICNESGNVLGMMPHPECHIKYVQFPTWTKNPDIPQNKGLVHGLMDSLGFSSHKKEHKTCMPLFVNMVEQAKKYI
jgi:phosphoribosylformylglycinamidine synthase subunit PurQ / glutaminase